MAGPQDAENHFSYKCCSHLIHEQLLVDHSAELAAKLCEVSHSALGWLMDKKHSVRIFRPVRYVPCCR